MRSRPLQTLATLLLPSSRSDAAATGRRLAEAAKRPRSGRRNTRYAGRRFDPRDAPLGCITAKGFQAERTRRGPTASDPPGGAGAFVEFAATAPEAQGRQIRNEAPGAEVIGFPIC